MSKLNLQLKKARLAARKTAQLSKQAKNLALAKIAQHLKKNQQLILQANQADLKQGAQNKLGAKLARLKFDTPKILGTCQAIQNIINLKDPTQQILAQTKTRRGFTLQKITVPLGVIAIIYEARPNVTVEAAVLALKAGNAVILRGSRDAQKSNQVLVKIMRTALEQTTIPPDAIQLVADPNHQVVGEILAARGQIDLAIPRGSQNLINFVVENAKVPVIETGASVVHLFIDQTAKLPQAVKIALNSKLRNVALCNALDTLILHEKIAAQFLENFVPQFFTQGGTLHAAKTVQKFLPPATKLLAPAFDREWLSRDLNLKIVDSVAAAIKFIQTHSLGHTEAICSQNQTNQKKFLAEVDAACVFTNLSTQFSDGGEFGLGAEMGISTQKLHARGPFALADLVSYKWIGRGQGEIRA